MRKKKEKPWKPSRPERRVMLVLLTGAANLSGFPIGRAAMVGPGGAYVTLAKLESRGWVCSTQEAVPFGDDRPPRRFYHLTPAGRTAVLGLVGLTEQTVTTGTTNA